MINKFLLDVIENRLFVLVREPFPCFIPVIEHLSIFHGALHVEKPGIWKIANIFWRSERYITG
jgi:hypothetical protein